MLVLHGEAGIGKTALLNYVEAKAASTCRIARVTGVESEMELAYAAVHQLCAPMLDGLAHLPAPQRDALGTAFGLSVGEPPDRFLVGLAVLSMLSEVAEERPLVGLVDDAQWLDRESAQILGFVARRLLAESVALVFAVREPRDEGLRKPEDGVVFAGLPTLAVGGLSNPEAAALLDSAIHVRLDELVRDRIIAETRGNPLALLELPRGLTVAELAGGFAAPDAAPLASRIEQSFHRQVQSMPAETQRLLLTAAAEPVGDVTLLWRAAERLGIAADAAVPAEAAGLIEFGGRVRFRHPLVRSAVYRAAPSSARQEIHRALAEATDPDSDPDRRAWHWAQATVGPDEAVAAELERSADRAQARGGIAAAAAFLERASHVTPDPTRRSMRALAAAQAKFETGAPDTAHELLAAAEIGPLDELQRARLARMRAHIAFARRRGSQAPQLLLDAAKRLETLDDGLARETYLEAFGAAIFAGRLSGLSGVREVAEAALAGPRGPQPTRATDLLLDGMTTRFTEGYLSSVEPLRRALLDFRRQARRSEEGIMRWLWTACPVAPEPVAPELWDDETWNELAISAVRLARETGALTTLPIALSYRASVLVHAGEFSAASALIDEAEAITATTGNAPLRYTSLLLASWRGDEVPALRMIEACTRDAIARGEGRAIGLVGCVSAVLYNGLGRYQTALAGAQRACDHEDLGFYGWSLVELVESGARSGARAAAESALRELELRTRAAGSDWALGMLARSRALLSDDQVADALYREAIERLKRSRIVVHLARAHLVYGEWLRRENRRQDARTHLRIAYEKFSDMGAEAFAERARRELQATGETVCKRTAETRDVLTAREAQIAQLAAEGHTNPEIGRQLFISSRTVEYHLHKVFTKLGIRSRRKLPSTLQTLDQAVSLV